jgi:AcrR family transcriptional regulator
MAARKPRTRDRILETSLLLFNSEGEPNVTSVDIANELDISPGNLYYHYKGKDDLVAELYARYQEQMHRILHEPLSRPLEVADYWFYLVVVFEQIHRYRFLYRNISLIMQRYEPIRRPFRRLIAQKLTTCEELCRQLAEREVLDLDAARIPLLARSVVLTVTYWFNFDTLLGEHGEDDETMIYSGVLQIMSLIAPYLGPRDQEFMTTCLLLYRDGLRPSGA